MWKVKRMNTARIVVLTIAIGAGGIAALPATIAGCAPAGTLAQLQTSQAQTSRQQPGRPSDNNFIDPRGEGLSAVRYGVASRQAMQT